MEIFIAHAHEDTRVAEEISMALRGAGHSVFLDTDALTPGSAHHSRIQKAISGSDAIVFLISPDSVAPGKYTLSELQLAKARWRAPEGCVVPVVVRDTDWDLIDPYLTSVAVLKPKGNIAAETLAAVQSLGGKMPPHGQIFANLEMPSLDFDASKHGINLAILFSNQTAHEVSVTRVAFQVMAKDRTAMSLNCPDFDKLRPLRIKPGDLRPVELHFQLEGFMAHLAFGEPDGFQNADARVLIKVVDHTGESHESILDGYQIGYKDGEPVAIHGSEVSTALTST